MTTVIPVLAAAGATFVVVGNVGAIAGVPPRVVPPTPRPGEPSDGHVDHPPSARFWSCAAWCSAAAAAMWMVGPFGLAAGILGVIGFRRARIVTVQRAGQRRVARDIPEALDLFVLLLEAGVSSRAVVVEMIRRGPASTRPAFTRVTGQLDLGTPFVDAIVTLRQDLGTDVVALVDILISSHLHGLAMAQVVQQLSSEARAARRRRDEAQARALPVKLAFPLVVCTLPSFVLLAIVPAVMAALSSLGAPGW